MCCAINITSYKDNVNRYLEVQYSICIYLPAFFLDFDLVPLSCPLTSCNLFSSSAFFFAVSTGESFDLLTKRKQDRIYTELQETELFTCGSFLFQYGTDVFF